MAQPPSRAVPTLVIWEGDASRARGQRQSLRTSSLAGHRLVQKAEHSASLLACTSLCSHSLIPTLGQCSPTLWSEGPSPGQMGMFTPSHGLTVGKNGDACAHSLWQAPLRAQLKITSERPVPHTRDGLHVKRTGGQ